VAKLSSNNSSEVLDVKDFDIATFISVVVLTVTGFFAIYSATYAAQMNDRFSLQMLFAAGGLFVMVAVALLPVKWFSLAAYPFYIICLGLLVYVAFAGKLVYGQRSWIDIGGMFQFQPSEIAKLGTLMAVGKYLSGDRNLACPFDLIVVCLLIIIPIGLIMLEPDPGSAMIYAALLFIILLWSGADLFLLTAIIAPASVAVLSLFGMMPMLISSLFWCAVLFLMFKKNLVTTVVIFALVASAGFSSEMIYNRMHEYQKKRIEVLLNPEMDPLGAGYNVIQTKMAIGSGGLTGKGYLQGTQTQLRYVPKQWTDFIISVPAEEFGFIGAMVILLLYVFLIYRSLAIASSVRSNFSSVVAIGITGIWFLHVTVNIGMTIGLIPVVGIPLPFMSYGGSSLITNMLMAGIMMNLYRTRRVNF
jgi:rod shape determining protein RodA